MKTIAARGFTGLVESWEASILNALDDKASKENGLDHKLVKRLLPEYFADIEELQAKKAELDATVNAAAGSNDEDEADGEDDAEELSEEELKATKKDLAAVTTKLKRLQKDFLTQLRKARSELDETSAHELVMGILETELQAILDSYVAGQRGLVVSAFETWWDKYGITFSAIEDCRDSAADRVSAYMTELGYA